MITHPLGLVSIFLTIISLVLYASKNKFSGKFFKYLPVPLWCYFLPTVISSLGWIPSDSPFYNQLSRTVLPSCLILLLVGTDLPSILKLSPKAAGAMLIGSLGIFIGGIVTFPFLSMGNPAVQNGLNEGGVPELWKGWGSLSASWTGGSANMIAVKEILQTPESLFSNLIIVDALVAYSWMALLVFLSKYQERIDKKFGADPIQTRYEEKAADKTDLPPASLFSNWPGTILLLTLAFAGGASCWFFSGFLPAIGKTFNRMTWTVILATVVPLLLSITPFRKFEDLGASRTGTFLLYLLLTSIGARANLSALISAPRFIFMGILWVCIHGAILLLFGKMAKIPISLLAVASQANVGGAISTPIVAGVYNKQLASIGIVLAVLGNIYGTFFGLILSEVCRAIADLL